MAELEIPHKEPKRPMLAQASAVAGKLRGKAYIIPNLITVTGIFCGFLAAIASFQGRIEYASRCVMLAVIVDFLDGRVARRLNATSEFGKELDSLSDLIAFGAAPAIILYCWAFGRFADEFGILISFIYLACGAIRLARFNVSTGTVSKNYFQGLPIPGAAGAIVTLSHMLPLPIESIYYSSLMMISTLAIAGLMVSTIPYPNAKNLSIKDVDFRAVVLILSVIIAITWYSPKLVLLLGFWSYLLLGPILFIWNKIRPKTSLQNTALH